MAPRPEHGHPASVILPHIDGRGGAGPCPIRTTCYADRRDAYLESWADFLPPEALRRAFMIAQQLAPAYHALSYRYIALATEPASRWELSPAVGAYLRHMIR